MISRAADLVRISFKLFMILSLSICITMVVYHGRLFSLLKFVSREDLIIEEEKTKEHSLAAALYAMGFLIDSMFVFIFLLQQRYARPNSAPHRWFVHYCGIFALFSVYFLAIMLMFSMRLLHVIDMPVSRDFVFNFSFFALQQFFLTLSAAMKTLEYRLVGRCTQLEDSFYLDDHAILSPVYENGGASSTSTERSKSVVVYNNHGK
ncbi:hypothetical protein M3Y96_01046700 [Aphelenchoides besseyi]|nr:hypothetical protein M3Y96_01046700 [Aphelenchoides besseyi]